MKKMYFNSKGKDCIPNYSLFVISEKWLQLALHWYYAWLLF